MGELHSQFRFGTCDGFPGFGSLMIAGMNDRDVILLKGDSDEDL